MPTIITIRGMCAQEYKKMGLKNNFSSLNDPSLINRIGQVCSVTLENPTDYGLNGAEVEALQEANEALDAAVGTYIAVNAEKLSASAAKEAARAEVLTQISSIVKRIYGDPNVDDTLLAKAGLASRPSRPTLATPNVPTDFTATVIGPNSVELKWKRNENINTTIYTVEVRHGLTGTWQTLTSQTATRFVDETSEPGQPVSYRVYAKRGKRKSTLSTVASVWVDGEETTLSLAA